MKFVDLTLTCACLTLALGCAGEKASSSAPEAGTSDGAAGAPDATGAGSAAAAASATAELLALGDSGVSGTLTFTVTDGGVEVTGTIAGLPPGSEHGFHIHETGDCSSPDGKSAGGHFNPHAKNHGAPADAESHVGDLGNVKADDAGNATISVLKAGATLGDGGMADILSRGLILHADADDLTSQPTGAAGSRIACAVIQKAE